MGTQSGSMLFVSAVIFGIGVTYFWPTMIGFVAIYLPKTGKMRVTNNGLFSIILKPALTLIFAGKPLPLPISIFICLAAGILIKRQCVKTGRD